MNNAQLPLLLILSIGSIGIYRVDATTSWRWCCTSVEAYEKCNRITQTVFNGGQRLPITCVQGSGKSECIDDIQASRADVMIAHSHNIYLDHEGLAVVGYEDYGLGDAGYYSVAVAKADATGDVSMCNLEGAKSCHTAVYKSAGWNMPIGTIARHHQIANGFPNVQLYDPFEASCAPGAANPLFMTKLPDPTKSKKWCKLCVGNNETPADHVCDRNRNERYYGYAGALRCLVEGDGDVAFVNNWIVTGLNVDQDTLNILCRNGSRAHPAEWESCNLGRIPSQGIIMREGSESDGVVLVQALEDARQNWDYAKFQKDGLLWSRGARAFRVSNHHTVRDYLGVDYYCNMKTLDKQGFEGDECNVDPLQCS